MKSTYSIQYNIYYKSKTFFFIFLKEKYSHSVQMKFRMSKSSAFDKNCGFSLSYTIDCAKALNVYQDGKR